MQRQRGIDTTYNMWGEIPYGRLGTRHISFVQDEIVVRGGSYDKKEGIRKLGKILLQLELTAQKNILKEKTGHEAEDSECNEKSYLPQCRSADDYKLFWSYVNVISPANWLQSVSLPCYPSQCMWLISIKITLWSPLGSPFNCFVKKMT
jgi:hypothetical protein